MSILIQFVNIKKAIKLSKGRNKNSTIYHNIYSKKSLMTAYESYFYHILKDEKIKIDDNIKQSLLN